MPENQPKKILIAEDEKPMAKALSIKLTKAGFVVDVVHNGEEAVAALEKNKYDILLLDLVMPRLDGFGVLEQLKQKSISVPTIILSNLGQEEDIQKTKAYGAVDHFIKSNTPIVEVVNYVNKALNQG